MTRKMIRLRRTEDGMSAQSPMETGNLNWLSRAFGSYALLRGNRNLALLFSGQIVSALGDWAYITALVILVYQLSGSATLAAALTFVRLLPYAIFLPLGGVLADRFDRKKLMIAADLGRAFCMLGLLAVHSASTVWIAFPLVFIATCLFSLFRPALGASIPDVAGSEENLIHANTLMGQIDGFALVAGPSLAGLLLLIGHAQFALLANAETYILSSATLVLLQLPRRERDHDGSNNGWLDETLSGFRAIFGGRENQLGAITLTSAGLCAFNGAFWTLSIVLAMESWHIGSQGAGFVTGAFGAGAVVGGLLVATLIRRIEISRGYTLAMFGSIGIIALLGLSPSGPAPFVIAVFFGAFDMFNQVTSDTMIQTLAPSAMLGRVFGAFTSVITLAMLAGALITGPLIATVGPRATTVAFAAIALVILVSQLPALSTQSGEVDPERSLLQLSEPL
jgi:MFS family permease